MSRRSTSDEGRPASVPTVSRRILVLNGPNLNLLGTRQPEVYGHSSLDDIMGQLAAHAEGLGVQIEHHQSNSEGALIDHIHQARAWAAGVVINPAAYTHTSVALRDAISAVELPTVEVHLSNVHARESFRHHSMLSAVCLGVVAGFGGDGYRMALDGLISHLDR